MVIANGFFKSNISSVLCILYGNNNDKKDNETNNNETNKKDNKSDKKQDTNNSKTPNLIYIYIFDLFAIILLAVIIRKSKTSK